MSKTNFRLFRIESLIRESLASLLSLEMRKEVLITIKSVSLNRDYSRATIACNIVTTEKSEADIFSALNEKSPYYRNQLAKHLNMRKTPHLDFVADAQGLANDKMRKFLDSYEVNSPSS